jgi:hypothetical protein
MHSKLYIWHSFQAIVISLNRRTELKRLIRWAQRKQRISPLKLYKRRYQQEEERLALYRIRHPQIVAWAEVVHFISNLISPEPRCLPKGSASGYRIIRA